MLIIVVKFILKMNIDKACYNPVIHKKLNHINHS